MSTAIINPPQLHDPKPFGYSHVVTASRGELVFVAGQYASDATGLVPDAFAPFERQVERAFENLGVALEAVGLGYEDVVQLRTFVVDHDEAKLQAVGNLLHRIWGDELPAQTLTGVASLALPSMQFEVDAIAVRA
jgi:enamine deaminase RidA (YjgF/YER057c/UK114 family)